MFSIGKRVRVLRGRNFDSFKERDEGVIVELDEECRNCHVQFDGRSDPVLVALKHLRVLREYEEPASPEDEEQSEVSEVFVNKRVSTVMGDMQSSQEQSQTANLFATARASIAAAQLGGARASIFAGQGARKSVSATGRRASQVAISASLSDCHHTGKKDFALGARLRSQMYAAEDAEAAPETSPGAYPSASNLEANGQKQDPELPRRYQALENRANLLVANNDRLLNRIYALEKTAKDQEAETASAQRACADCSRQLAVARSEELQADLAVARSEAEVASFRAEREEMQARYTQEAEMSRHLRMQLRQAENAACASAGSQASPGGFALSAESSREAGSPMVTKEPGSKEPRFEAKLFEAASTNNVSALQAVAERESGTAQALLQSRDHMGRSLLHVALASGANEVVRLLLAEAQKFITQRQYTHRLQGELLQRETTAVLNGSDMSGRTPLAVLCTCAKPDTEVAKELLMAGADPAQPDAAGVTPFMECARSGNVVLGQLLIQASQGAVLLDVDLAGQSALHWAAKEGQQYVVELLLRLQVEVELADNEGRTAEMLAANAGHRSIAALLRRTPTRDIGATGSVFDCQAPAASLTAPAASMAAGVPAPIPPRVPFAAESPLSPEAKVKLLDTATERDQFRESLAGKRVLHVKGFGSGFQEPNASQAALEVQQVREAIDVIMQFNPDFLVVDGDPWGNGFQRYVKAFIDAKRERGGPVPSLIWAKNITLAAVNELRPASVGERKKRVQQAMEWAEQDMSVIVFWIDPQLIKARINFMFGTGTWKSLESEQYDKRGLIRILCDNPPRWVSGVNASLLKTLEMLEHPSRQSRQFLEKCSFENAAKGNVIFDSLDVSTCAAHGVVSFGGGEAVILEFATYYLNSVSGFDQSQAAVYQHSRGKEGIDPPLPCHVGTAFVKATPDSIPYANSGLTSPQTATYDVRARSSMSRVPTTYNTSFVSATAPILKKVGYIGSPANLEDFKIKGRICAVLSGLASRGFQVYVGKPNAALSTGAPVKVEDMQTADIEMFDAVIVTPGGPAAGNEAKRFNGQAALFTFINSASERGRPAWFSELSAEATFDLNDMQAALAVEAIVEASAQSSTTVGNSATVTSRDLLLELKQLLEDSCDSGALAQALAEMKASSRGLLLERKQLLEDSCDTGALPQALAEIKASSRGLLLELKQLLEDSCDSGALAQALAEIKVKSQVADDPSNQMGTDLGMLASYLPREASTDRAGTQFNASAPTRQPRAPAAAAALRAGLRSGEVAKIIDEAEAKATVPLPAAAAASADLPVFFTDSGASCATSSPSVCEASDNDVWQRASSLIPPDAPAGSRPPVGAWSSSDAMSDPFEAVQGEGGSSIFSGASAWRPLRMSAADSRIGRFGQEGFVT